MNIQELRLCETEFLGLRPNQLYIFTVDPNCNRCVALAKIYEDQEKHENRTRIQSSD